MLILLNSSWENMVELNKNLKFKNKDIFTCLVLDKSFLDIHTFNVKLFIFKVSYEEDSECYVR